MIQYTHVCVHMYVYAVHYRPLSRRPRGSSARATAGPKAPDLGAQRVWFACFAPGAIIIDTPPICVYMYIYIYIYI